MAVQDSQVMFTGGVPYDSVEDVFRALSGAVGDRAIAYPDGEIGELAGWVTNLNRNTWPKVEGLDQLDAGDVLDASTNTAVFNHYKIKDGVTELDVRGLLPYARVAIESYAVFQRLRDGGVVPQGVRFQMALPGSWDAFSPHFPYQEDWPIVTAAWQKASQDEVRRVLEVIPPEDLSIQIDWCMELIDASGVHPLPYVPEDVDYLERFTSAEYLAPQVSGIPDEVLLGFHICGGTFPAYPVADLPDISLAVKAANDIVKNAGRRVDFVHMPCVMTSDESYFAPLADLEPGQAKVFLGLECNDGQAELGRRIAAADKHYHGFGIAHYCGYMWNKEIMARLLDDLNAGADKLAHPAVTDRERS